jgi:hypothetical protein
MRIIGGGQLSKHGIALHSAKGNALISGDLVGDDGGAITLGGAITANGTIKVKEQASADGSTGDYGQLWIKTAVPTELYFTTDAGDDIQVTTGTSMAGGSPWTTTGADAYFSGGNIAIGSSSTGTYKLDVNGDLSCDDVFTNDINMSNDHPEHPGNEIDGTKGTWSFQEGEEHMYLINRKSGKRYKLMLEEV